MPDTGPSISSHKYVSDTWPSNTLHKYLTPGHPFPKFINFLAHLRPGHRSWFIASHLDSLRSSVMIHHLCLTFYLVYRPIHPYSNRDLNWAVWAQFIRNDFQHWKHLKRDWVKLQSFEKRKKMIKTNLLTRVGNFHLNHLKIFSQSRTLGTIPLSFPSGISKQEFWGVLFYHISITHVCCQIIGVWPYLLGFSDF